MKRKHQIISYTKKERKREVMLWIHMVNKAITPYEKHE